MLDVIYAFVITDCYDIAMKLFSYNPLGPSGLVESEMTRKKCDFMRGVDGKVILNGTF